MKRNLEAIHSNSIVQAGYHLTANQQKLLLLAASKVHEAEKKLPKGEILKNFEIEISAKDFAGYFGVPVKAQRIIERSSKGLLKGEIRTRNEKGEPVILLWANKLTVAKNGHSMILRFNDEVFEHLANLKEQFTIIRIDSVEFLKSGYAIRLYQILVQWKRLTKYTVSLEALRFQLGLPDRKYAEWRSLRQAVINPAIKEINKWANDINVLCLKTERNRGSKVDTLVFLLEDTRKKLVNNEWRDSLLDNTLKEVTKKKKKKLNNLPNINIELENLEFDLS